MAKDNGNDPTVKIAKNGPYLVSGPVTVQREGQDPLETQRTMALCRCGQSAKKPFCDGTHSKVGFHGTETADRGNLRDKRVAYAGAELTIFDDRTICSHAAVCSNNMPTV
ncbi:MAG: CDGSH iron-sulfur domain-containing protein, partial [SAR324 cluster bacterium]|nr:CDGSH iron-sulfur domain-containing protein [SAR324 cluster bacterium]